MIYSIENEKIRISVSTMGAELVSLINKETGVEYLWQADPEYWTGHAYNLFPICGRLWDGKYTYLGNTYEMNLHGFARKTEYEFAGQTDNTLSFRLADSEKSYAQYPFRFVLTLTYTIEGSAVKTTFSIENKDEKELIYAVGGHPGFNVPLAEGEKFSDYTMTFSDECAPEALCMSETCYYLGKTVPYAIDGGRTFRLDHKLFDNDAIFMTNVAHEVTLKSDISGHFVTVNYPEMNYVGFWHKPKTEAPYVCIEPWMSIPADDGKVDDLETKRDMLRLAPGCKREIEFTITIG